MGIAEEGQSREVVSTWVSSLASNRSDAELLELLGLGVASLYAAAAKTLTPVTLAAILDRVAAHARTRFPSFARLEVGPAGLELQPLRASLTPPPREETIACTEFVLTEFLGVLGALTAEILTPRLHAALAHAASRARSDRGLER